MSSDKILNQVNQYYSEKIKMHGATPQGVDWNSAESQQLRFKQVLKIVNENQDLFSILDYGCGFGSMHDFMKQENYNCTFHGFDISEEMIQEAKQKHPDATWISDKKQMQQYDYVIASGIFNVKLDNTEQAWKDYMLETLQQMHEASVKGFSFNVLTKYSDKEFMRDYLYYADPLFLFDYCKTRFSKQVALLHDYPLYEFTILVKK